MSELSPSAPTDLPPAPAVADGVEVLGPMAGSGYRTPPVLVRRGDGQMLQLTPLLGAVLAAVDGQRDPAAIADHVARHHARALHPDDVATLIDSKLRPLGLLRRPDGAEPALRRADPLLGLRGRIQLTGPDRTFALARPFLWLFHPVVVGVVVAAFAAFSTWVLLRHGLGTAIEEAIDDPALLLGVVGLVIASGAFHELGHATACRYGGARPRAMGAAVYLVWPAFYTDVTDSYRLDRTGRLRVDLGGLYFNAVFTCGTGLAWAATGVEALLVLVPVQLLQMVRQLVPIVRFDGYHILADLVGVPDLYARIRPTLARVVPGRRRRSTPNPLTRRAQVVVVAWVAVVVPFLVVSLGLLVWNLPPIMAAAVRSLDAQQAVFADNVASGRVAAAALGIVAMATVAFLPLSAAYLLTRIAHRSSTRFWAATEGRPLIRSTAVAALVVAVLAAGPGLLPTPPGGGADLAGSVGGDPSVTELAAGSPTSAATRRPVREPALLGTPPAPDAVVTAEPAPVTEPAPSPTARVITTRTAPAVDEVVTATSRAAWPFSFDPPAGPRPGDNQALAVNTVDRTTRTAWATSLQWPTDGRLDHRNEAWALAQCIDCRTVAVAFQVVAAVGEVATATPRNVAVSANEGCERCETAAVAVQLAVTLDELPPASVRAEVQRVVARVNGLRGTMRTASADEIRTALLSARAEVLELLHPWLAEVVRDDGTPDETTEETPAPSLDEDASSSEPGDPDATVAPAEEPTEDAGAERAGGEVHDEDQRADPDRDATDPPAPDPGTPGDEGEAAGEPGDELSEETDRA